MAEGTVSVLQEGNANFDTLYKDKMLMQESKLQKVYGTKTAAKMQGDFKRDVTDATVLQVKKLVKQYEDALNYLERSKEDLQRCIHDLAETIPHQLHQLQTQKENVDQKMDAFQQQMTAIIDTEKDLQREIEKVIRYHKQEVEEATQQVYRTSKYQANLDKIEEINQQLSELEAKAKEIKALLIDFEIETENSEKDNDLVGMRLVREDILEEDLKLRKKLDDIEHASN